MKKPPYQKDFEKLPTHPKWSPWVRCKKHEVTFKLGKSPYCHTHYEELTEWVHAYTKRKDGKLIFGVNFHRWGAYVADCTNGLDDLTNIELPKFDQLSEIAIHLNEALERLSK